MAELMRAELDTKTQLKNIDREDVTSLILCMMLVGTFLRGLLQRQARSIQVQAGQLEITNVLCT